MLTTSTSITNCWRENQSYSRVIKEMKKKENKSVDESFGIVSYLYRIKLKNIYSSEDKWHQNGCRQHLQRKISGNLYREYGCYWWHIWVNIRGTRFIQASDLIWLCPSLLLWHFLRIIVAIGGDAHASDDVND